MSTAVVKSQFTPADLLAMPDSVGFELVDGNLVERPVSVLSSFIGGVYYYLLFGHCLNHKTGGVWPADNGYQCYSDAPNKVRKPDASFVRRGRLTLEQFLQDGFCPVCPDLVVEVISPNELAYEVEEKIQEYLRAGVALIWIVYPESRRMMIYRADGSTTRLGEQDELNGENVLPGFSMVIRDIFALAQSAFPIS